MISPLVSKVKRFRYRDWVAVRPLTGNPRTGSHQERIIHGAMESAELNRLILNLDDAVVRDGLADHWRESYVCEAGKSMKAVELAVARKDSCCNISKSLIDLECPILNECNRVIPTVELKTLEDRPAPVEVWWPSPGPFRGADQLPLGKSANRHFGFPRSGTNRNHREFFVRPQFP